MEGATASVRFTDGSTADPVGAVALVSGTRWIVSGWFDGCFFLLSPLAGLALVAGYLWLPERIEARLALAGFYFIGLPHYLSTLTFYLGDENLRQFRERPVAFFAAPLLILAAVPTLWTVLDWRPLITAALYTWNIYHVSRQSAGILNIYRRLNGGPPADRTPALIAILSATAAMALWPVHPHPAVALFLGKIHPQLLSILDRSCVGVAIVSCILLASRMLRRSARVSLAEAGFLLTSLGLGLPYLLVDDLRLATLAMLMGHFVQYLALVWLLNRRKYGESRASARERSLGFVARHPAALGALFFVCGVLFWTGARTLTSPAAGNVYWCLLISSNFIHFYLDGLIWAFRRPEVRRSLGPYLFDRPGIA